MTERETDPLVRYKKYVEQHNIKGILKDCVSTLCLHGPDNPYQFFADYFTKLNEVTDTSI